MSYLIVLRYDSAGTCPVVLREDDQLMSSDGARWRLVAQTDDPDLAARIVEQLRARRETDAPTADGGSGWESNPPLQGSARSQTALKAAQVTRPESLPRPQR